MPSSAILLCSSPVSPFKSLTTLLNTCVNILSALIGFWFLVVYDMTVTIFASSLLVDRDFFKYCNSDFCESEHKFYIAVLNTQLYFVGDPASEPFGEICPGFSQQYHFPSPNVFFCANVIEIIPLLLSIPSLCSCFVC